MQRRDWFRILVLSFVATGLPLYLLSGTSLTQRVHAYLAGPPAGFTHAPGEFDCSDCHVADGAQGGQTTLTVPPTYIPGQTYQIAVHHFNNDPSRVRWGFQLTALDDSAQKAGNLQSINALTQVLNNQGPIPTRQYIGTSGQRRSFSLLRAVDQDDRARYEALQREIIEAYRACQHDHASHADEAAN